MKTVTRCPKNRDGFGLPADQTVTESVTTLSHHTHTATRASGVEGGQHGE